MFLFTFSPFSEVPLCARTVQVSSLFSFLYRRSNIPIILDNVICSSSDVYLLECSHRGIGVNNCSHSEDIELTCSTLPCEFAILTAGR